MSRYYLAALLICLVFRSACLAAENGPANDVPELKVLEHYAGLWDTETTSENALFKKGKVTAKWVLGGRFLQQSAEATDESNGFKYMSLITYDPAKKVYRTWIFLSDGHTAETEGTWDEDKQIMTSIGRKDGAGGFTTTTADFSEKGVEKWKLVYTDGTGKEEHAMSGKNTRRSD